MADTILQILQWAIPSGGVGAAIAWIANRKVAAAKATKEVHDAYKSMYEDVSSLVEEIQDKYEDTREKLDQLNNEHALTRRALNRLSRAIEAIQICPHRGNCPVRTELSISEVDAEGTKPSTGHKRRARHSDAGAATDKLPADKGGHGSDDAQS